ncbi:MAG: hypothetical protein VKP72_11115 [bacterium]|nr:hypothetical protein [bacterium]
MDINATHFRTCDMLQALARTEQADEALAHLLAGFSDEDPWEEPVVSGCHADGAFPETEPSVAVTVGAGETPTDLA